MDQRMFGYLIWSLFEPCTDHFFIEPVGHHYATFKSGFIGTNIDRNSSSSGLHRCKIIVKITRIEKMDFMTVPGDYF